MTTVYRQWSRCRLVFHQHQSYDAENRGSRGGGFTATGPDVIQCQVTKSLGQVAGGFTATLVPRQEYLENLRPNDWVEVFLDAGEPSTVPVMTASLDRVARRRSVEANGATREVIALTGRDYGKVFTGISLVMDPLIGAVVTQATFDMKIIIAKHSGRQTGSGVLNRPHEVIRALVREFHDGRIQCVLPDTLLRAFAEYEGRIHEDTFAATGDVADIGPGGLALRLHETQGRLNVVGDANVNGNLWGTMEQFSNPMLNEMWLDTEGGLPTLHLEERPFSERAFGELNGVAVEETEVTQEDFGKSDQDTRNWFRVHADGTYLGPEISTAAGVGVTYPSAVARAGLRKFEQVTNAYAEFEIALVNSTNGIPSGLLQTWSETLAAWYANNDRLLAGSMTTRLRPDARIGRRLDYTNKRTGEQLSFYIEGVTHQFQYPGASTTAFSLTRGVERAGDGTFPGLREQDAPQFLVNLNTASLGDFKAPSDSTRPV